MSGSANGEEWGWTKQLVGSSNLINHRRSGPGAPPRERHFVYQQPWTKLTPLQRQAAHSCLGIVNEAAWEMAMPRRLYGVCASTVLVYQSCTWKDLQEHQQQDAQQYLQISEDIWNEHLAVFHDDLWTLEGISLTSKEFKVLLSALEKLSNKGASFRMSILAQFLFQLRKVLTPSQGKCICETVKASLCWGTFYEGLEIRYYNIDILVASFLSSPKRFLSIDNREILAYWDDDNIGCRWGNNYPEVGQNSSLPTYGEDLERRYKRKLFLRLVGLSFTRARPLENPIVLERNVVETIIDRWVGDEDELNPQSVTWVTDRTESAPYGNAIARSPTSVGQILSDYSTTAGTNKRKRELRETH